MTEPTDAPTALERAAAARLTSPFPVDVERLIADASDDLQFALMVALTQYFNAGGARDGEVELLISVSDGAGACGMASGGRPVDLEDYGRTG